MRFSISPGRLERIENLLLRYLLFRATREQENQAPYVKPEVSSGKVSIDASGRKHILTIQRISTRSKLQ